MSAVAPFHVRGIRMSAAIATAIVGLVLGFAWYVALIYVWPVYAAVFMGATVHVILRLNRRMRWQPWILGLAAGLAVGLMLSVVVYLGLAAIQLVTHGSPAEMSGEFTTPLSP